MELLFPSKRSHVNDGGLTGSLYNVAVNGLAAGQSCI